MGEGNFVLPTGTATLVLGDVEGSTRAWESDVDSHGEGPGRRQRGD